MTPDGPLPTVALEEVREGIYDARYLGLAPAAVRKQLLAGIPSESIGLGGFLAEHDNSALDTIRWRAARAAIGEKGPRERGRD